MTAQAAKRRSRASKTQEIMTIDATPEQPVLVSETARALALIERVIADKDQPVERVEQAFALYQRVLDDAETRRAREAEIAFRRELPIMQGELPIIQKRGKGHNDARYARWEDIAPVIQPILTNHGFGLQFFVKTEPGEVIVRARLSHRDGHYEDTDPFKLPADTTGNKNVVQALGSSTSYAKRYLVGPLLNLVFEGEDDDGRAAVGGFIDDDQIDTLRGLVKETDTELADFFRFARVEAWDQIPAKEYPRLRAMLLKKRAQIAKLAKAAETQEAEHADH